MTGNRFFERLFGPNKNTRPSVSRFYVVVESGRLLGIIRSGSGFYFHYHRLLACCTEDCLDQEERAGFSLDFCTFSVKLSPVEVQEIEILWNQPTSSLSIQQYYHYDYTVMGHFMEGDVPKLVHAIIQ